MKDTFLYVLGTNPYENCKGDYHTRCNGEWSTDAADLITPKSGGLAEEVMVASPVSP